MQNGSCQLVQLCECWSDWSLIGGCKLWFTEEELGNAYCMHSVRLILESDFVLHGMNTCIGIITTRIVTHRIQDHASHNHVLGGK